MAKPWIKLWGSWYETTSHRLLSPRARHTGPHLLWLAARDEPDPDGVSWVPFSLKEIAKITGWSPKVTQKILKELCSTDTLIERDGKWGFPNFARYQESKSASRMRRHREKKRHSDAFGDGPVTTDIEAEDRSRRQKQTHTHFSGPPVAMVLAAPAPDPGNVCVRLREALEWGHSALTPPEGAPRLRVPTSFEAEHVDGFEQVLAELDTAARRIEAGDLGINAWRGTWLLTPNGYARMTAENAAWRKRANPKTDIEDARERLRLELENG